MLTSLRRTFATLAIAFATLAAAGAQNVTGFSDLNFWGTGSNRAALVISWNDGKADQTIAWGFSWDGSATVADMLFALANADSRLFLRIDSSTEYGPGIFGIGYDTDGNGFSVTGAQGIDGEPVTPVFVNGISDMNTNPAAVQSPLSSSAAQPSDPVDHYVEAWNDNGFWELYSGTAGAAYPALWTSSLTGSADTLLVNDGWFALSITNPDYSSNLPGPAVAAIPEPGVVALLAFGAIAVVIHVKRRRIYAA